VGYFWLTQSSKAEVGELSCLNLGLNFPIRRILMLCYSSPPRGGIPEELGVSHMPFSRRIKLRDRSRVPLIIHAKCVFSRQTRHIASLGNQRTSGVTKNKGLILVISECDCSFSIARPGEVKRGYGGVHSQDSGEKDDGHTVQVNGTIARFQRIDSLKKQIVSNSC
jgi:hypothetical protein